ncbi:MAG TPA: ribosomal protein S18-alanine N-acetyltransferase [Syntrophorhabdaceae bacterium]|nr:ribosomal protein S18-alanine N-acetyltransferase [Syntrophorhabdaceae bacterium]
MCEKMPSIHDDIDLVLIREMGKKDIKDILEIERLSFITPWTANMFLGSMSSPINKNFVMEWHNKIIGYIMLYSVLDEAHITNFAIRPEYRKKGYGHRLLLYAIDYYKKTGVTDFFLEVREKNFQAINLYRRFDFNIVGRRRRYYSDTNEDALIMHLSIK